MPIILAWLRTLTTAAFLLPLLKRLAVAVGLSLVSYVGVGALMSNVEAAIIAQYGGMSADVVGVLAIGRVDDAISVVLSAFTVKLTMIGLDASGALKKVLLRPNQQGTLWG